MSRAWRYVLGYLFAVKQIRDARTGPRPTDPFSRLYAFARERVGLTQQPEEIEWLWQLVRELEPRVVVEIGLDRGGTLFLWTRAAADDALVVSIDSLPPGRLGGRSPFAIVRRRFARDRQRVELLLDANSHDPSTLERVRSLVGGCAVDFLFVDGDHTYEGVAEDFEMYAPLVRPGGLVAFHDVSPTSSASTEGVSRWWRDFTASHPTEEKVVDREGGFGIGVYRVPGHRPAG